MADTPSRVNTVDAHATRLLLQRSPPEACVDSSLGPYVTSILRKNLAGGTTSTTTSSSTGDATNDLVDLLESHCQLTSDAARDVLSIITLAVQTGDVSGLGGGVSNGDSGVVRAGAPVDKENDVVLTTRSRSKSLGAEPAYDVKFLGKFLKDSMPGPSIASSRGYYVNDDLHPSSSQGVNGASSSFSASQGRTKPRTVTFDETLILRTAAQPLLPIPATQPPFICHSTPCSSEGGIILEDDTTEFPFAPPDGILDVLDLECDDDKPSNSSGESDHENQTNDHTSSTLPPKNADRKMPQSCIREADDPAAMTVHQSRPRSNSLMDQQREASDLAASLFRPSRPRSNSLMDRRQRPLSPPMLKPLNSHPSRGSAEPLPSRGTGLLSASLCGIVGVNRLADSASTSYDTFGTNLSKPSLANSEASSDIDAAELNSTTQLLLTINSHLGKEAASLASQLTGGDLNLAQYLIEAARSDSSSCSDSRHRQRRSRICRHELRGVCYRADCPYNHDLTSVTCLFWLKGRCRERSCRFLHGFAEGLLEGISEEYLAQQHMKKEEMEQKRREQQVEEERGKKGIHTTNLLHHNQWSSSERNLFSSSYPW
ncbi:hypothetical protein ACHAWF_007529 [Thalassiosira exigua]